MSGTMSCWKPPGTGFASSAAGARVFFIFAISLLLLPCVSNATDRVWTGGTTTWGTSSNWGGTVPVSGDNAVFSSTFASNKEPTLGTTSATVGGIWMTGSSIGVNVAIGGSAVLSLNGNTINGTPGLGILVNNTTAFTLTINAPVALGGAQSWTNNSTNLLTIGAVNLNAFALTVNGTGNTTISGVVSGTGSIQKAGAGTLILSGANTYSGTTTINAGTLKIGANNSLPSTAVTVSGSGAGVVATLDLNGFSDTISSLTLGGSTTTSGASVVTGLGTLTLGGNVTYDATNNPLGATIAGNLALGATRTFTIGDSTSAATDLSVTAVISGTTFGIVKAGSGTLSFSGANTFTGQLTIQTGTLSISSINNASTNGVLGNSALAVILGSSGNTGTLEYSGATSSSSKTFSLATSGTGAFQIDTAATVLTLSGIIGGNGGLQKSGAGTLTLSGANNYAGGTTITAGTLQLSGSGTLGGTSGTLTVNGGTLDVNGTNQTVGALVGTGGTILNNTTASAKTLTIGTGGGNGSYGGVIADHSSGTGTLALTKTGAGGETLTGANTYTGLTTISAGFLNIQNATALGTTAAGTTVSSGAALQIEGNIAVGNEALTLNGGGISSDGALRNISGDNTYAGGITLASASTIASDSGTLTLGGGIGNGGFVATFIGSGNITESGVISGSGGVTKTGAGTLTLSNTNSYLGNTTINGGILSVSSNGNLGGLTSGINLNAGTLEIATGFTTDRTINLGDAASTFQVDASQTFTVSVPIIGTGTLNKTGAGTVVLSAANQFSGGTVVSAGTLQLGAVDRLLTTAGLTISGGTFDLQTFGQTTGAVTLSSGSITGTGTGTLTGSSYTLQSGTVSAILAGNTTVTKNTTGSVTLSGANTFTGSTTISAGTLQINTNNALGTAASGTTVASGAVLTLNNVNYTTAEPLTLNGSGIGNGGALRNTGTSTFAGPINAATNATINAGGGTLNLTGGLSKNATTLTFAGGGTVNINTNGITGSSPSSDLVVDGVTVNENAANSYNGPTYIRNGGVLNANVANALPTASGRSAVILDDSGTGSSQLVLGAPQAVASLTGASTSLTNLNGNTLTIGDSAGTSTFAGIISGTGGLTKDGASTQRMSGANTYSGATTINGGSLTLANGSGNALGFTSSITVNSGGTLVLGATDQINNTAPVTLAGGTFAKGDFSEGTAGTPGVGALTLTASGSHLDFGAGTVGVLTFASFTPGNFTLTIDNWTGTPNTVGTSSTDRLIFASDQSANLSSFSFTGYGPGAVEFDLHNGYWEVTAVPVPETSTWVAATLAFGVTGFYLVRRRRIVAPASLRESPGKFPN